MLVTLHFSVFLEKWDWRNPDHPGIGGSETAVSETAWRLAARGHDVTVYAPIPDDCEREWKGTHWRPLKETDYSRKGLWLISRQPAELDHFPMKHPGQTICLVSQDVYYPNWTDERWEKLDWYIALCPTHLNYTRQNNPKYAHKVRLGFNGIRCDLIRKTEAEGIPERNPRRLWFASSPDRGLPVLLKMWPRIREWVHDAELWIGYGMDNIQKMLGADPLCMLGPGMPWKRVAGDIEKLVQQPGVTWLGRMGQPELYRRMMQCAISPHLTTFPETGFIQGLECMAMGVIPIVMPTWAAGDYCQHGIWIFGDPNDPLAQARCVGEIFRLMSNPPLQEQIRQDMIPYARGAFNWERFIDLIETWVYGFDDFPTACQYLFGLKHANERGRILNVGCGNDAGLRRLGAINMDLYAVDPVTNTPNDVDVIADARLLPEPFEPHSFGAIVAMEVLEHYPDDPDAVPEQLRIFKECLAPGGRIILTVPDDRGQNLPVKPEAIPENREPGLSDAVLSYPENYGWHKPCPPERIDRWLKDAGLRAIAREPIEYPWRDVTGTGLVCVPEESDTQADDPIPYRRCSVVYTDYDPQGKLTEMRAKSREKILKYIGDTEFIVSDQPGGWEKAVNVGLAQARGEYIYVVGNDVMIDDLNWLEKMAVPDTVTAWAMSPFTLTGELDLELSLFCIPRKVYVRVGGLDESLCFGRGYGDNDLLCRVRAAGFKTEVRPILAQHLQSQTLLAYMSPEEMEAGLIRNRDIFKAKHPELEPEGGWLL